MLKATIPLLLPHLKNRRVAQLKSEEVERKLLTISAASIDRVLLPYRERHNLGRSLTKPGSLLRSQLPISTEVWDTKEPGFVEADTVAQRGNSSKDLCWNASPHRHCNARDLKSGGMDKACREHDSSN